jgi:hypothetical protein
MVRSITGICAENTGDCRFVVIGALDKTETYLLDTDVVIHAAESAQVINGISASLFEERRCENISGVLERAGRVAALAVKGSVFE